MAEAGFDEIAALADGLAFGLCGVARAEASAHADRARQWIAEGRHGEMAYLADHLETRLDPKHLLPGARSIIAVADAYRGDEPPGDSDTPRGRVARYAWGRDYHKVIKKRLHRLCDALADRYPGQDFRATVDTAPAFEREHAARAGLGWTGKHTLLIHPRHGSYFLLGLVLTTLEIGTTEQRGYPAPTVPATDHCAHCTRCIDACPTDAIGPVGYTLDARRCISYLTIEHRSRIDPALHEGMGDWIAGCDVCQDVCPYNQAGARNPLPVLDDYALRGHAPSIDLVEVLGWTEDNRRRAFSGTALTRIKLPMIKRNALIAAGNALHAAHDGALRAAVQACVNDDEPLVRETAREVLAGLTPGRG